MNPFQIDIPVKVLFGAGQLDRLHEQALPGKKALIVTVSYTHLTLPTNSLV